MRRPDMSDNPRVQAYPFSFFLCYILIIIFILYSTHTGRIIRVIQILVLTRSMVQYV